MTKKKGNTGKKKPLKTKVKDSITIADLPRHLRSLADVIEKGEVPFAEGANIDSISAFKLIFKYGDYKNIVRTRIVCEYHKEPEDEGKSGVATKTVFLDRKGGRKKPGLKKLRKKLDQTVDEISSSCDAGNLPDRDLAAKLYQECEALVLHSGDDGAFLEEYLKSAASIVEAAKSGSLSQARGALERIRFIQTEIRKKKSYEGE